MATPRVDRDIEALIQESRTKANIFKFNQFLLGIFDNNKKHLHQKEIDLSQLGRDHQRTRLAFPPADTGFGRLTVRSNYYREIRGFLVATREIALVTDKYADMFDSRARILGKQDKSSEGLVLTSPLGEVRDSETLGRLVYLTNTVLAVSGLPPFEYYHASSSQRTDQTLTVVPAQPTE